MANRTVSVALVADVGQYQSAMVRAAATTKTVGDSAVTASSKAQRGFEAAGRGAALLGAVAAGGLVLGLKSAVDAASNAEQSIGGVQAVYKDYAASVIASSKEADRALGLSANSYRELATIIGSQMKNAGVPLDQLADKTEGIIGIGADLAAQFGGSTQEAVNALSSAFRGELDPIERYGISLTAAAVGAKAVEMGLAESETELSQNAKTMATLAIITEQSADAQGAFGRESDTAAGRAQRAAAQWENLKVAVGDRLLPAWSALVDVLGTKVIPFLGDVLDTGGDVVNFMKDNKDVALALAGVLAVQLAGGIGAVTLAFDRMVLLPAAMWLGNLLGAAGSLSGAFAAARTAVANFVAAAAPLVAVGAIVYAISKTIDFATAAGDARKEVDGMWDAVDDSRGSAQLEALAGVVDQIEAKIRLLREELPETKGAFEGLLSPTGMLENGGAVNALDEYEEALRRAKEAQEEAHDTARILGNQFGLTGQQVLDLADKYDIDLTQGIDNAYIQFQRFYTSEYGQGPMNSTHQLRDAMATLADVTSTAEERIDALKTALDLLGGKTVSVFEAQSALQQVVQSATGALEGLTGEVLTADGHLNAYSESGQKAGDILVGIRDKGNDLITTMVEQGATIEEVRAADAQLRQSFIDSAMQMGISEEAANALATEILGVPEDRETRFTAATDQAAAKIAALQAQIDAVSKDRTATINFRSTMPDLNGSASGTGRMGTFAEGGYTGSGSKYQPAGIVHAGEYVLTKDQTSRLGIDQIEAFANSGYAGGGLVTLAGNANMSAASGGLTVLDSAVSGAISRTLAAIAAMSPAAGGGSLGGAWGAIWQYVKTRIPQARQNSTFRAGDPGYHGKGKAIDFGFGSGPGGAGSAGLASINRLLHDGVGRNLAELIYDGIGDDRPDLKNGKPLVYSASTRAEHRNHVHAAVYDQGGPLYPGYTLAYNGTGKTEWVSKEMGGGAGSGGIDSATIAALARAVSARSTSIAVTAPPNEERLVRKLVDAQRDLEFLHG